MASKDKNDMKQMHDFDVSMTDHAAHVMADAGHTTPDEQQNLAAMKTAREDSYQYDESGNLIGNKPKQMADGGIAMPDKLKAVMDYCQKAKGYAMGGEVTPSPQPSFLQQLGYDPDKISAIVNAVKNSVGQAGQALTNINPLNAPSNIANAAIQPKSNPVLSALTPDEPNTQPQSAQIPQNQPTMPPEAPKPQSPSIPTSTPLDSVINQEKNFDPTKVAPGMNPEDRTALAAKVNDNQHSFGSYLGEALAGLGDALGAWGGNKTNHLGAILSLQKQQRDEALSNFDKAREVAVQNQTLRNQANQKLISDLQAKDELYVSPAIAKMTGHPELAGKSIKTLQMAIESDRLAMEMNNTQAQQRAQATKEASDQYHQMSGNQPMMTKLFGASIPKQEVAIDVIRKNNNPTAFGLVKIQQGNQQRLVPREIAMQATQQDPSIKVVQ